MELTTKLRLKKPGLTDHVNIADLNDNMDILDGVVGELKEGSTVIEELETTNKTLSGAINELFTNVSDGKQVVATAITGKGVPTSSSDTFQKMATNIDAIETDPSIGTTNAVADDILLGKKVISEGKLLTGTIPSKAAATITPTTSPQTIAANQYLSGAQTIAAVVVPLANVLAGITIAGAVGTMPNKGALNQTITSNNGQISIASGYYTGGVIKAVFANLIAANIKTGVNIGGVVGTFESASGDVKAGTFLIKSIPTNSDIISNTPNNVWNPFPSSCIIQQSGIFRIEATLYKASDTHLTYGRVYKNGVPYGTEWSGYAQYTQDLRFERGDTVKIYGKSTGPQIWLSVFNVRCDITSLPAR